MAAGADLGRVYIVRAVCTDDGKSRRSFNLQSDLVMLEHKINRIGDVRLVIIDPISSYLGPNVNSHANGAVRGVLEPLGEMASRMRVAFVSITHPPKATGTTAINRFIGSIAFVAAARAAFLVTRDPGDEGRRLLLPVKNNLASLGKGFAFWLEQRIVGERGKEVVASSVAWESDHVDQTADQALQATEARSGGRGAEAEEFLKGILGSGPVPIKDIQDEAKAADLSWATVRRAKSRLRIEATKDRHGRRMGMGAAEDAQFHRRCSFARMSAFEPDEHLRTKSTGKSAPIDAATTNE